MFTTATARFIVFAASSALALSACHRDAAPGGTVKMGHYRVVLKLPGGDLPFGLELQQENSQTTGYLINGQERLLLDHVEIVGSHLKIPMPGYLNILTADASGDQLEGELFLDKLAGKNQHIPLHATLGQNYRFFAHPAAGGIDM